MSRAKTVILIAVAVLTAGAGCGTSPAPQPARGPAAKGDSPARAGFFRVERGAIVDPQGRPWRGLGLNLPNLRNLAEFERTGAQSALYDDWQPKDLRPEIQIVRIYAAGNQLTKKQLGDYGVSTPEQKEALYRTLLSDPSSPIARDYATMVQDTVAAVQKVAASGRYAIVAIADYYHNLPGEQMVRGDHWRKPEWCSIQGDGVRPLYWYRRWPETFDFTSKCLESHPGKEGDYVRRGEANYRRFYLYYVRQLVGALKDEPAIFAWALGNELRALGLGLYGTARGDVAQQRVGIDLFAEFVADMVAEIRAIDANHMIMPGVQHMGEVADADLSNDHDKAQLVEYALPKMLAAGFDLWNLTFYDNDANIAADIERFRAHGIPVVATEWDSYSCLDLPRDLCSLYARGLQMVAPWSPVQMQSKCGDWRQRMIDGMIAAFNSCPTQPGPPPPEPSAPGEPGAPGEPTGPAAQCAAGQCSDCDAFWQDRGGWGDTSAGGQRAWQTACLDARQLTRDRCAVCAGFTRY